MSSIKFPLLVVAVMITLLFLVSPSVYAAKNKRIDIVLEQQHESRVSGTGTIVDNGNGTSTVSIRLTGGPAEGVHPVHIHAGVCTGTVPTIVYPLHNIQDGKSITVIKATLKDLTTEPMFINVHESMERLHNVIACGAIGAPKPPTTGRGALGYIANKTWLDGFIFAVIFFSIVGMLMQFVIRESVRRQ